jgi:hypothetical protein
LCFSDVFKPRLFSITSRDILFIIDKNWMEISVSSGISDVLYQTLDSTHCFPLTDPIVLHDCVQKNDIEELFTSNKFFLYIKKFFFNNTVL